MKRYPNSERQRFDRGNERLITNINISVTGILIGDTFQPMFAFENKDIPFSICAFAIASPLHTSAPSSDHPNETCIRTVEKPATKAGRTQNTKF